MSIDFADPKPAFCSACHAAKPESRYVDMDAAHDGGDFVNELGTYVAGQDDLMLCEDCVRDAAEVLALKPDREAALKRENVKLRREVDHWKDTANRGLRDLNETIRGKVAA